MEFAKALADRKRKLHHFDGMDFLGPSDKVVGAVKIRVPVKSEEIAARVQAAAFLQKLVGKGSGADDTLVDDARSAHILHSAVRDAEDPENFSAWPSPQAMMDCLSNDEMGVLMNLVHSVIARESPTATDMDDEVVEKFVSTLGDLGMTAIADTVLAPCDREFLMQLCILMAMKLRAERKANTGPETETASD